MDDIENLVDDLENLVDKFRAWPWVTEKDQNFMKKNIDLNWEKMCISVEVIFFTLKHEMKFRFFTIHKTSI